MLAAPICCITMRSSRLRMSITRSTPGCPNAPRPQMYGRPTPTAVAPSASALKRPCRGESRCRRTRDPAAHRGHDLRQRLDRAAQRLVGAAAVVRHDDAVRAVLDRRAARPPRVTMPLTSTFIDVAPLSLFDVVPGEARAAHACAFVMSTPSNMCRNGRTACRRARGNAWQRGSAARLPKRADGSRLRAGMSTVSASAVQPARSARLIMPSVASQCRSGVELEPDRRAARGRHVLDGEVRDRREDLERVLGLRGARDGDLAFGVEHLLRADGAEEDRRRVALAEDLDRHVDVGDVDEPLRPKPDLLEAVAVSRDRAEVVGALRHVRVVAAGTALRITGSKSQTFSASSGLLMRSVHSSAPDSTASSCAAICAAAAMARRCRRAAGFAAGNAASWRREPSRRSLDMATPLDAVSPEDSIYSDGALALDSARLERTSSVPHGALRTGRGEPAPRGCARAAGGWARRRAPSGCAACDESQAAWRRA